MSRQEQEKANKRLGGGTASYLGNTSSLDRYQAQSKWEISV